MSRILVPLPDLQLDPRNTEALLSSIQTRIYLESNGLLNDFSPASPLAALTEGQAYAQSELLYYLNNLPEAFVLQWLRIMGIQRVIGSHAFAEILFFRQEGYNRTVSIPAGTEFFSSSGLRFYLVSSVEIDSDEPVTGVVKSEKWGRVYNVSPNTIVKTSAPIVGLSTFYNLSVAVGGESQESVGEMKSRAFTTLNRRGLITKQDYIQEIQTIFPEISTIEVFSYDELSPYIENLARDSVYLSFSVGSVTRADYITAEVLKALRLKTPVGTTVSVLEPITNSLRMDISFEYNTEDVVNLETLASSIYREIRDSVAPENLPLGSDFSTSIVEDILQSYVEISGVNNVSVGALRLFNDEIEPSDIEGCSTEYRTYYDDEGACLPDYIWLIETNEQTYVYNSPIDLYYLYELNISAINTYSYISTNFKFKNV